MIDPLEWTGAALGIAGWFGVRQIGNQEAQLLGMSVWVLSGLLLMLWGHHAKARGIVAVNAVNVMMAASGIMGVIIQ